MTPSEILECGGWCQGHLAEREDGTLAGPCDDGAVRRCGFGAIIAAYPDDWSHQDAVFTAVNRYINSSLPAWNDQPGRTKEEVIAAFKAIGQ